MPAKILVFTRHSKEEFGFQRIELLRKVHGKRAIIEFENQRFAGSDIDQITACIEYFKKKIEEGYYCYVILPKFLRQELLGNGIAFGRLTRPKKVDGGHLITVKHYSPESPESSIKISRIVNRKKRESRDYKNKSGSRKRR